MLTFDVEEYFHAEAAQCATPPQSWQQCERRLAEPMERILAMLERFSTQATFFILGWVAREVPNLVTKIASAGHEVASHGMTHAMLTRLSPQALAGELGDSRKLLQDLSGQQVSGFRAPTFSVMHSTAWALDVLVEQGYRWDSSVFPVRHDRYGVPEAPAGPHLAVGPGEGALLEIPPLVIRRLGRNWPAAGGGYLRLFPVGLVGSALRSAAVKGFPGMIYAHPWELDPHQPILAMPRLSRWRHRVGLGRMEGKIQWLLQRFRFTSVAQLLPRLETQARELHFRYGQPKGAGARV